jgi:hypothetical protein
MACTVDHKRCAELITRYRDNKKSKSPNFTTQFNAVFHLLGRLRLSRHNIILAGKFIAEMQDTWTDKDQMELIDSLRERQQRSWARHSKRIAEYAAAKAAGTRGKKKEPTTTTAPEAPPPNVEDIWEV